MTKEARNKSPEPPGVLSGRSFGAEADGAGWAAAPRWRGISPTVRLVYTMRVFIILVLWCVSAVAAETGIQVSSTVSTNAETGAILTSETFTRRGQTNLIRITKTVGGIVVFRSHQFCHHGEPVALFTWRDGEQHFHTYPGTPYSADVEFLPSKDVRCVILMGKDWFDGFYCTNMVYYPAPDSDIEMKDLK
jgi:hypothetical protein